MPTSIEVYREVDDVGSAVPRLVVARSTVIEVGWVRVPHLARQPEIIEPMKGGCHVQDEQPLEVGRGGCRSANRKTEVGTGSHRSARQSM